MTLDMDQCSHLIVVVYDTFQFGSIILLEFIKAKVQHRLDTVTVKQMELFVKTNISM